MIGVFGNPISHTSSPQMMNPFLDQSGLNYLYVPLPTNPNNLQSGIEALRTFNFVGANVTIPHKEAAFAQAQNPVRMALAMKQAVEAGWLARRAGRIPMKLYATASSPLEGLIE